MRIRRLIFACVPLAALSPAGCDVDVNDPGQAPDVNVEGGRAPDIDINPGQAPDVNVEAGRAPDVDVTPPDVDVRTEERTIKVPNVDVDVNSEETRVKTPNIDIDIPKENETEPPGDNP